MLGNLKRAAYAAAEPRAILEYGSFVAALPWLLTRTDMGDGHTVLVFPPWFGDDGTTASLRSVLRARGYVAEGWQLGRNLGVNPAMADRVVARVEEAAGRAGAPISLVGWSAGGIAAREAARLLPERVRLVVTLGSPFGQDLRESIFGPVFRRLSGPDFAEVVNDESVARLRTPPPVPSTAIYTESDGVVPPEACREQSSRYTENIRVPGAHCGLAHNPLAVFAVLDRLAQPTGAWQPFEASGVSSRLFGLDATPEAP